MTSRPLLAPTVATGLLMPAYLAIRPYGEPGDVPTATAEPAWVVAHLCGIGALAALAVLVGRLAARRLAAPSLVLVALYYVAETFGLAPIRDHPAALALFGLGLLGLAVSAVLAAIRWQRVASRRGWALWPLALLAAAVLPQYFLPPAGRVAFGVAWAVAAAVFAGALLARPTPAPAPGRPRGRRRPPVPPTAEPATRAR